MNDIQKTYITETDKITDLLVGKTQGFAVAVLTSAIAQTLSNIIEEQVAIIGKITEVLNIQGEFRIVVAKLERKECRTMSYHQHGQDATFLARNNEAIHNLRDKLAGSQVFVDSTDHELDRKVWGLRYKGWTITADYLNVDEDDCFWFSLLSADVVKNICGSWTECEDKIIGIMKEGLPVEKAKDL